MVIHGDSLEVLRTAKDSSVDACVTDPPYLLGFMGKRWDAPDNVAGRPEIWTEVLRVLKPGGHLLCFGATRTHHRVWSAIEDAGFEIRDTIMWMYGTGFPKSHDIAKGIDKALGAEREVVGSRSGTGNQKMCGGTKGFGPVVEITTPATPEAAQWQGWGTALKPAHEPICVARKPLVGTVAANVLEHGTGGINIDGCRIAAQKGDEPLRWAHGRSMGYHGAEDRGPCEALTSPGRWPANVCLDEEAAAMLDEQSGTLKNGGQNATSRTGGYQEAGAPTRFAGDSGGASRFFYCAKASKAERGPGNTHPTVKPTELMRWLVRLVTPPGGIVLDPFCGSGTTGVAARLEGMHFVGIEREAEYAALAKERIERCM